jgi:hypothetical protein
LGIRHIVPKRVLKLAIRPSRSITSNPSAVASRVDTSREADWLRSSCDFASARRVRSCASTRSTASGR